MHEGHRKRMTERLSEDADGLRDHELFEILLFYSIPRVNTNPLGHELLRAFGSVEGVLSASEEELLSIGGVGPSTAALLRTVGLLCRRAREGETVEKTALRNPAAFIEYAETRLGPYEKEVIEFYFLDKADRVKFIKTFSSFEADRAQVQTEELAHAIAAHRPKGIVAAHNHPFASAKPSREDDEFTARLQLLCSVQNVALYDHIIVGGGPQKYYSYFLVGALDTIRSRFNVDRMFRELR